MKSTVSVWSTCREWDLVHQLHPSPFPGLRTLAPACLHCLSGYGHRFFCCPTCSSFSSCFPAQGQILGLLVTVSYLSALPCSAAATTLPGNQSIREARRSLTHRGQPIKEDRRASIGREGDQLQRPSLMDTETTTNHKAPSHWHEKAMDGR